LSFEQESKPKSKMPDKINWILVLILSDNFDLKKLIVNQANKRFFMGIIAFLPTVAIKTNPSRNSTI
jgi:hypothetical protein